MDRSEQKTGLVNLLILLAAAVAAFAASRYANILTGQLVSAFLGLGVLVSFVSWFQMRLEENERLEKLELEELSRSKASSTLFESKEAELFPAQRSRVQFEKYFVPGFAILILLLTVGSATILWRWLGKSTTVVQMHDSLVSGGLFLLLALILFLIGRYSAAVARLENQRLLRPSASYVLLGSYLSLLALGAIVLNRTQFAAADFYFAKALCVMLAITGAETLVTLILEIYRPRVKGRVGRPLYESRLVGLLGHPEGLVTTVAEALDYQFGFKVSETGFYRVIKQYLPVFILAQLGVLILSDCVVFVGPGEQALLEHSGRLVPGRGILNPGVHFKMPWPIGKIYRYRTEQIQVFEVGAAPDADHDAAKTIMWSVGHGDEENFLVANRDQNHSDLIAETATTKVPPVSFLTVSIPVHFQINNLTNWAYGNSDSAGLLQDLATREVVRYLVSADMNDLMSQKRLEATEELHQRIQVAANANNLGVNILFVGLQDIHPPVKVAKEYEKVVGATHTKRAKILDAQAEAIRTNALSTASAFKTVNNAQVQRLGLEAGALARAALFTNQIPAFEAAPSVFQLRAYLRVFEKDLANTRKYILLATNAEQLLQFDLQDKFDTGLLSLKAEAPKPK